VTSIMIPVIADHITKDEISDSSMRSKGFLKF
jgi:hypothetical protein